MEFAYESPNKQEYFQSSRVSTSPKIILRAAVKPLPPRPRSTAMRRMGWKSGSSRLTGRKYRLKICVRCLMHHQRQIDTKEIQDAAA